MIPYSINLIWSDEDKGYIATVPEFKNLSAFGETPDSALKEAQIAIEGYIKTIQESGDEMPEPKKVNSYSGQIRFRMPRQLHKSLTRSAESEGVSLNTFMVHLLSANYAVYQCQKSKSIVTPLLIMSTRTNEQTNYLWPNRSMNPPETWMKRYSNQDLEVDFNL